MAEVVTVATHDEGLLKHLVTFIEQKGPQIYGCDGFFDFIRSVDGQ